jgi:hypothetical protein
VWPVHASKAFLCVTIQSTVPLRCSTDSEVIGDLVEMSAVIGVVEDIRWYKKGMPRMALLKGPRIESVDCAYLPSVTCHRLEKESQHFLPSR